jgi:ubiquinone/menaquinone biosynthesis C-methylase UbiE
MSFKLINLKSKTGTIVDNPSSIYWNDESIEKDKVFNVIDLGFDKIEASIKYKTLIDSINKVIAKHEIKTKEARVLSLASGSCWVESQIFNRNDFKNLTNLDLSQHRIHKLAPFTMNHYGINKNVNFIHGSVFDMDESEKKYDIIFMSQAFHHIDEPIRLLRFLKKMLSKDGYIVIVGEHFFPSYLYHKQAIKHFIKYIINWRDYRKLKNFYPAWQDLFQPDYDKGDIHWSLSEYNFIFNKSGFKTYHQEIHSSKIFQSFVIKYNENNE